MATPTVEEVWADPDFQGLPAEEKRKVLLELDTDFADLPQEEQNKVIGLDGAATLSEASPQPSMLESAVNSLSPVVDGVKDTARRIMPQMKEAATLGLSSAPQMAERVTNYVQQKPNAPGKTLLEMASNRPDVTASIGASIIPGTGLLPAVARTVGQVAASAVNPNSTMAGNLGAGALNAGFEALPYGVGKIAKLFNVKPGVIGKGRELGVQAAKEWKVPLTRFEQTGNMFDGGVESTLEKTLTGGKVFQPVRQQADEAVNNVKALFKRQYGIDAPPSAVGKAIVSSADNTVASLKSRAQEIYDTLPSVKTKPAELRNASESLLREQLELPRVDRDGALVKKLLAYRKLGTKMEKKIQHITDDFGFTTQANKYKKVEDPARYPTSNALRRMSSDLGQAWKNSFKVGEKIGNVSGRDATILSSAIQRDIQQVGELRGQLDEANKLYRQAKNLDKNPLIKRLRTAGPEEATGILFDGKKLSKILVAKKALGDQAYATAKSSYFTKLLDDPQLAKKLNGMSNEYVTTVFSAEEVNVLRKVGALQELRGAANKLQGTSGSARTNAIMKQISDVKNSLLLAAGGVLSLNPVVAATGLASAATAYYGPKAAANAYLKRGMNGLDVGAMVPKSLPKTRVTVNTLRQYLQGQQTQPGQ